MTNLLSPGEYDDDASLRSPSEQDSDSEDDEFLRASRTSLELAEYDRTVLDEEDEREKLLTRSGPTQGLRRIFSPISAGGGSVKIGKRERRRRREEREKRRQRRKEHMSEEGELMYEMEEGDEYEDGDGDDQESLISRPEVEENEKRYEEPRVSRLKYALVFTAIFVLFLIIVLGAYKASTPFRASRAQPLLFNGSSVFAPTTILISLDGFRADFVHRGITPALSKFIAQGVSPQYMTPSFPSVTFPNHFTLVTGLYPESHGVVGNSFYDPQLDEDFYYTDSSISMQPKWWNAEPIWNTLEKRGIRSAIHMWPGSEAHVGGMDPDIVDKFNSTEELSWKTDRILELLDLPDEDDRPQFIAAYVPNVDSFGHKFGPNSTEVYDTISQVDGMLGDVFAGMEDRNLTNIVNVVIVSDHGMATTATERLVQLEDLVDLDLVDRLDGWPSRGIRPKRPEGLKVLEAQLQSAAPNYSHAVEIYTRENMPERYHFSNNDRIAPLWIIPKAGWAIVEREELDARKALEAGEVYRPRGIHGYDHEHPLMRAIFLARGPAFAYPSNSRVADFRKFTSFLVQTKADNIENVNVYNILCDSLGIEPLPNNGTLRLPLQPVGLHSDEDMPVLEHPQDLPSPIAETSSAGRPSTSPITTSPPKPTSEGTEDTADYPPEEVPQGETDTEPGDQSVEGNVWDSIWGTVNGIKDWAVDLVGGLFG